MLSSVLLKTLRDQRISLIGWISSIALVVLMYAAIWPSIRDQPSMADFLDQLPEAFRALFLATGASMTTPVGYIQIEMMSFMAPLLVILYAVVQGSGAIAGEEERQTLDLLLANPVGRLRVMWEKAGAAAAVVVLLAASTGAALILIGRPFDLVLPVDGVAAAMLHLALLGMVFGALSLAIGASTGRAGPARGAVAVVAVVAYLVNALAPLVSWLDWAQELSPFYQYNAHDPLRSGVSWPAVLVAVATVAVLMAVASWGLRRRDIHG